LEIYNQVTIGENLITILVQTLEGLNHLHLRGIVHRDLKLANLLIVSENPFRIKIADFGLASDKLYFQTFCGTQLYVAPKVYLAERYTPAMDIWSLAVILLLLRSAILHKEK
jgi:serine/threonine protein kinase